MRFIVAVLFSTIVVRSSQAQLPMAATDLSRWLNYQEKINRAGDAAGSAEAFRRAVALDPAYAEAHTDLGVEDINLGLLDDAVAEFRSATALDPATIVHHANLGLALMILGRLREAEPEARTAVALDGTNTKAQFYWVIFWPSARKHEQQRRST